MPKLEICSNSLESALNAQNGGADRIELCAELSLGGVTPSYGTIKMAVELLEIPVYVLIRPRSGDFVYSNLEISVMKEDISFCAEVGCHGVVFGALKPDRTIDEDKTAELMQAAGFMDATFHKAFDEVPNPFEALDTLKELGMQRILTSGGAKSAVEGMDNLGELLEEAEDEVIIMPGGGIRGSNLHTLLELEALEYHSSAITKGAITDVEEVKALKGLLS